MVRTKQHARKSTGGKAPAKPFRNKHIPRNTATESSAQDTPTTESAAAQPSTTMGKVIHSVRKTVQVPARQRYRHPPGTVALREIRQLQKSTDYLLPRAAFARLVRQYTHDLKEGVKWQKHAVDALQEAAEHFLVSFMDDANMCALHAGRVTLMKKDIALTLRLRLRKITRKND